MSQKLKTKKGRGRSINWFGFRLERNSAAIPILFFLSLFGIIGCTVSLIWMAFGFIQMLSAYSAVQATAESYGITGLYAGYGTTALMYYVVWFVIMGLLLGISIYTFNCMKKGRG